MNKLRRQELKQLKYIKRIKRRYGNTKPELFETPRVEIDGVRYNMTGLKNHSVTCSCFVCSGHKKYKRSKFKKQSCDIIKTEELLWL